MARRVPRHRTVSTVALAVLLVLAALLIFPRGAGGATAPAEPSRSLMGVGSVSASVPSSHSGPFGSAGGFSGAAAGSLVRSVFPNYNASLPGNFPGTVQGWQIGTPAYVPSTQQLWLPNRPVPINGIPAPTIAPAIIYNVSTHQFGGFDMAVQNTSAFFYDTQNSLLFAADWANNTVAVISPVTGAWVHPAIPVGTEPDAFAMAYSSGLLYVANLGSNNITVVNTTSYAVYDSGVAVGNEPVALALDSPDSTLFVADGGDAYVRTMSTRTDTAGPAIHLPGIPAGAAYSHRGNDIAVSIPSYKGLDICNASGVFSEYFVAVGPGAGPVITGENDSAFIVGNQNGSDILTVNSSTFAITRTINTTEVGIGAIANSAASTEVLVWGVVTRGIATVSTQSGTVLGRSASLSPEPSSTAYDSNSNRIYVVDSGSGIVSVLNGTNGRSTAPGIEAPAGALSVSINPGSGKVYVGTWNGVYGYWTSNDSPFATQTALSGENSPIFVDPSDGTLWVVGTGGIHVLSLANLSVEFSIPILSQPGAPGSIAFDPEIHEAFVVNQSAGVVEAVDSSNGAIIASAIRAGSFPSAIAFDSADQELYVAGSNITVVNPFTYSVEGPQVPLPVHIGEPTIAYDSTRAYLYVATDNASPSRSVTITVVDGTSLNASEGSAVEIRAGELASDVQPFFLAGGHGPAYATIWVANTQSGTLGIISSPPIVQSFSAAQGTIDLGQTAHFLLAYAGGAAPDTIAYSGLPPGCTSHDTAWLNCTPTVTGSNTISVTISDALGESTTATAPLVVETGLSVVGSIALVAATGTDVGTTLNFSAVSTGGAPPYSYTWQFGDGTSASGPNAQHAYSAAGTYAATIAVTDGAQATATDAIPLTVHPDPSVSLSAAPSNTTDANLPLALTATVTGGTGGGAVTWAFGDGTSGSGFVTSHAWAQFGTYFVTLHYTDSSGGVAVATSTVVVNPALGATFSDGAPGGTTNGGTGVSFTATVVGGTAPFNVTWSFDDGSYGYGPAVTHRFSNSGTYLIQVVLVDAAGARVEANLSLTVSASVGAGLGGANVDAQLFLGILIGFAAGAVLLWAVHRSRHRPRHPPSPYVPPEGALRSK